MPNSRRPILKHVGLKQIAEELDVSVSLVSKVLSGRLGTSGAGVEKIEAIKAKAKQVGYRKNLLAHALRTGRQNAIAVYVHRHGLAGTALVDEMMMGIAEEATRLHQRLIIHYYETADEFLAFQPRVYANAVDGVIIGGLPHRELVSELSKLHRQGMPVVTILDWPLSDEFANVGMDQIEITRRSTLHLIDQGCRRIAHIRSIDTRGGLPQPGWRYDGYLKALAERNIAVDPSLVIDIADYSYLSGQTAAKTLLSRNAKFDGIVGQTDQHAVGALNHLMRSGVKVPEDVKVVGVDNAPFCDFTYVPLSSVSQEFHARGVASVKMLMQALDGAMPLSLNFEPIVMPRTSSDQ